MQRLLGLTLLTLSLTVPTASLALGLGDIHVESALHQPLVAQIELVGATGDELGRLNAVIASDEIFGHYNLERAPFIYGTTLVVGQDGQGHPVLNVRSTEKFTEPVVTFLVDLHAPNGELIREYTIFLDPPDLVSKPSAVESTSAATAASSVPAAAGVAQAVTTAAESNRTIAGPGTNTGADTKLPGHPYTVPGQTYTVARRDTLDHIVNLTGARSATDRHRMMIAIFRANPAAFQNNLNKLHTGVTLHFPLAEQLTAISAEDANREYDAQMAAWRVPGHRVASAASQPTPATPAIPAISADPANSDAGVVGNTGAAADSRPDTESQETDPTVLTQRVASLEKSLNQLKQELKQPLVAPKAAPVAAAAAPAPEPEVTADDDEDEPLPAPHHKLQVVASLTVGMGLVLVAGVWFYRRRWTAINHPATAHAQINVKDDQPVEFSKAPPPLPQITPGATLPVKKAPSEPQQLQSKVPSSASSWFEDSFSTPIAELLANEPMVGRATEATVELSVETTAELPSAQAEEAADTTVMLAPDFDVVGDTVEQKFSFFNPESANNTEHVVMGGLHEPKPFVERRKNPVDVLRQAIEREPDRSDLRLKLLELYYTAAAENRRAFLDATRQLAKNEKLASAEDWSRIADMGRTIAPDDELFSDELDDKRVA
jgi:pilus assembly protein FimV